MLSSFTKDEKKMLAVVLGATIAGSILMAWRRPEPEPLFMDSYHGPGATTATAALQTGGSLASKMIGTGSVDLNTANKEALQAVSGIGPSLASTIIAYRNAHGPFHSFAELDEVKGVGPSKLAKIEQGVIIGSAETSAPAGMAPTATASSLNAANFAAVNQVMAGTPHAIVSATPLVYVNVAPAKPSVTASKNNRSIGQILVNINTANEIELAGLKRVGPVLAKRIVEYRLQHGAFPSPAALQEVKGIGPKTLEENLGRISVR